MCESRLRVLHELATIAADRYRHCTSASLGDNEAKVYQKISCPDKFVFTGAFLDGKMEQSHWLHSAYMHFSEKGVLDAGLVHVDCMYTRI